MTAMTAALLALASEVEAGEGPDREMDARVWCALHDGLSVVTAWYGPAYVKGPDESTNVPEPVTGSVDAALALLASKLPGWCYDMDDLGAEPCVRLYGPGSGEGQSQCGKAWTLPRAIVAATLRAVAGRAEG